MPVARLQTFTVPGLICSGGAIGFTISYGICSVFPEGPQEFVGKPELSPLVAVLTATALGIVGLLAGYFPARRAARSTRRCAAGTP